MRHVPLNSANASSAAGVNPAAAAWVTLPGRPRGLRSPSRRTESHSSRTPRRGPGEGAGRPPGGGLHRVPAPPPCGAGCAPQPSPEAAPAALARSCANGRRFRTPEPQLGGTGLLGPAAANGQLGTAWPRPGPAHPGDSPPPRRLRSLLLSLHAPPVLPADSPPPAPATAARRGRAADPPGPAGLRPLAPRPPWVSSPRSLACPWGAPGLSLPAPFPRARPRSRGSRRAAQLAQTGSPRAACCAEQPPVSRSAGGSW